MSIRRRKAAVRAERAAFWIQWQRDTEALRDMARGIRNEIFAADRAADDGWPPNG